MKNVFGDQSFLRRSCLALYVCAEILRHWDNADMPTKYAALPKTAFEVARHFLLGIFSKRTLEAVCSDYNAQDEECMCICKWEEKGEAVLAYTGSAFVLDRVLQRDDELYEAHDLYTSSFADSESVRPTEEYLGEHMFWDVYFVGSIIAAKGPYWYADRCDNELRRRYWLRWIDETVPQFLGDVATAKAKGLLA
jgi:hypothetical protein